MMMAFERRFGRYVWEGSKTHSIRAPRNGERQWRVGDLVHADIDVRKKSQARLGVWKVRAIGLVDGRLQVTLDERVLEDDETDILAWMDGFRSGDGELRGNIYAGCAALMQRFWIEKNGLTESTPFVGPIIYWKWTIDTRSPTLPAVLGTTT